MFRDTVFASRFCSVICCRHASRAIAFLLAFCGLAMPLLEARAQTAQFAYAQVAGGLNNAAAVAVDGGGAVYIADAGNGRVLKETPVGGGYTQMVVAGAAAGTPLYLPFGVAVDRGGSVYIADANPVTDSGDPNYQKYRVLKETPSGRAIPRRWSGQTRLCAVWIGCR